MQYSLFTYNLLIYIYLSIYIFLLFIYLTKWNINKYVKFRHAGGNVVDNVTDWLTQIYIAICTLTGLKSDVLVRSSRGCLHDNHLRFRPLSSTIRSHQNDCTRLHDCVSACGMRYLCVALLVQVLRRYCIRRIIKQRVSSSFCLCTGTSSHLKFHDNVLIKIRYRNDHISIRPTNFIR